MLLCPFCFTDLSTCWCSEDDWDDDGVPLGVDGNGLPVEYRSAGGLDVVVHYGDIPESDITEVQGIRCTTALRTVIDLAPDLTPADLRQMVTDFLMRGLFTVDQAWERLGRPDMQSYAGAEILRRFLDERSRP
jgi:hypothetical protein